MRVYYSGIYSICQLSVNNSIPGTYMKRLLSFIVLIFISINSYAVRDGFYGVASYSDVIGPGSISINNQAFGSQQYANHAANNNFNLANDGRFEFSGSIGYVKDSIGIEAKYINLGSQHQTGVNGNSLQSGETGTYGGSYYGLDAQYFVPLDGNNKHDLFFSLGAGKLRTTFSTVNSQAFNPASSQSATQSEIAALLGVGARFTVTDYVGLNIEADRITPVTHGLLNSGIYGDAYTVFSVGLVFNF